MSRRADQWRASQSAHTTASLQRFIERRRIVRRAAAKSRYPAVYTTQSPVFAAGRSFLFFLPTAVFACLLFFVRLSLFPFPLNARESQAACQWRLHDSPECPASSAKSLHTINATESSHGTSISCAVEIERESTTGRLSIAALQHRCANPSDNIDHDQHEIFPARP